MSSRQKFGKDLTTQYKPGFIDPTTPELLKASLEKELSEISKAFYNIEILIRELTKPNP